MTRYSPSTLRRLGALALWLLFGTAACSAPPFDTDRMVSEWAEYMQRDYVLRPGDTVTVTVYQNEDLTQEVVVSPLGTVNLRRLAEPFRASDLTIGGFRAKVQQAYAAVVNDAEVSVTLTQVSASSVYVAGEVRRAGPIAWVQGMTAGQAIAAAGGFLITAKDSDVRILRSSGSPAANTYRVDMESVLYDGGPDFLLLPGDIVFCQTSGIADVGNWVDLYIRRLLPINPGNVVTGV
jgi:polysaccharide export outer membrane protein